MKKVYCNTCRHYRIFKSYISSLSDGYSCYFGRKLKDITVEHSYNKKTTFHKYTDGPHENPIDHNKNNDCKDYSFSFIRSWHRW